MIFTSNRVNDFKVPLGLQKHDKLCVVMDFFLLSNIFHWIAQGESNHFWVAPHPD